MLTEKVGRAELYLADCMDIMRDMPDKAFELAIVDPPYGDGGELGKQEAEQIRRTVRQVQHQGSQPRIRRTVRTLCPPESITDGRNTVEEISDRRGLP